MGSDWSSYYRTAYERLRKENGILAEKLAEAQALEQELAAKYNRITANPAYRMLHQAGKVRHLGRFVKRQLHSAGKDDPTDPELVRVYEETLALQKNPYAAWIADREPVLFQQTAAGYPKISAADAPDDTVTILSYQDFILSDCLQNLPDRTKVLLFAENPDNLDTCCAHFAAAYFADQPQTLLWYAQEDLLDQEGHRYAPWFKPVWSPDTLLGFFYPGSCFAVPREAVQQAAAARQAAIAQQTAAARQAVYAFVLSLTAQAKPEQIGMTDLVLYHTPEQQIQKMPAGEAAVDETSVFETTVSPDYARDGRFWGYEKEYTELKQRFLASCGFSSVCYQTPEQDTWTVVPCPPKEQLVSIVIPTKDHPGALRQCVESLVQKTAYRALELIVVDNGSTPQHQAEIRQLLEQFADRLPSQYLLQPMAFNFSAMCNLGAAAAKGEFLLLLNDDMEILEENWLTILVGQAMLPGTGAVGAKLWYPGQERIQHAGITNMTIGPAHKLVTFPDDRIYYFGHNSVPYDMIAVTAACLLIRKELYEQAGRMNEELSVAYNDVDFCFTLYEMGFRNVQRNDAVLHHHESLSRGLDEQSAAKQLRLQQEKAVLYRRHPRLRMQDPYYGRHFSGSSPEYAVGDQFAWEDSTRTVPVCHMDEPSGPDIPEDPRIMLTVERAQLQMKNYLEEEDILMAEGWCYRLDADNARYTKSLLLHSEDGEWLKIAVFDRYRYDVEAILPQQRHVGLAGFVSRVCLSDLKEGTYQIGILYQDQMTNRESYRMSTQSVCVKGKEKNE